MNSTKVAQRGRIVGMRDAGLTPSEISRELGISRTTVYKWLQRWDEEECLDDHPKSGRPRETTPAQNEAIREGAAADPFTNAVAIREQLQLEVTPRTVRKRLHEAGIHYRTPAVKEKLSVRHREHRLRFAQLYADQDLDYWGRVVWSDEKSFCSTSHGKLHCWRRNNER